MQRVFQQIGFVFLLHLLGQGIIWSQTLNGAGYSCNDSAVSLLSTFSKLERNYPLRFYFREEWFVKDTFHVPFENKTLEEAMRIILNGKPYAFKILYEKHIVILPKDKVAVLVGQLLDYSGSMSEDKSFIQIGDLEDAGHRKIAAISGQIRDAKSGDPVIGATIQVNNLQQGAVTNLQGQYKLALTPGLYTLLVSCVGYEKNQYHVKVVSDGSLDMELFDRSIAFDDIIIYGQRVDKNVSSHQMSLVELDARSIKQLPSLSGGKDILKGLTTMPGVKSIGEFSSGINVRGGGEDQNLYLYNGAPLFNTSHVFGLITVINPDAVDKLTLYKGHIPAVYGERVSSVVDIRSGEVPPDKITLKGGVGLYDSKLLALIPVIKNKVFFDIGGRTNYSNWILQMMNDYNLRNSSTSFYDLNGTLHIQLLKSRIALSGYSCYDAFRFASEVRYGYGSNLGSLNWNYMHRSNLASYLTLSNSQYHVTTDDISTRIMQSRTKSGIRHTAMKYRLKYSGIRKHNMDAGLSLVNYFVKPGKQVPLNDTSLVLPESLNSETAYEGGIFINDEFSVNNYLTFNMGLRVSGYVYAHLKPVYGLEPRFSTKIQLNDFSSIKLSFNRNIQYLSLISPSSVSTPADIWKLTNDKIKPMIANQIALGYYRNFLNNSIETSIEVYYKGLRNVVEYEDGAEFNMNPALEEVLLNARGENYGVEFLLRKNTGKFDGWISYTYSRSLRKTNGESTSKMINDNGYYPSSYDKPHDFTIVATYHANKRVRFTANFSYATGRPVTLPDQKYTKGNNNIVIFPYKNQYRIPDYHRLDLSLSIDESLRLHKKWRGSWSFSVLNIYGRKNAYTIYYKKETASALNDYRNYSLYKLYLIGRPVPTITYSFIF